MDQRCESCIKRSVDQLTVKMKEENIKNDLEMQLIESLKTTIKAKDDLIESLKKEITRLSSVATTQYMNVPNENMILLSPGEIGGTIPISPQPINPYAVIGWGGTNGDTTLAYKYTNERDGL